MPTTTPRSDRHAASPRLGRLGILAAAACLLPAGAASAHLGPGPIGAPGASAGSPDSYVAVRAPAATAKVVLNCMVEDKGGVKDCSVVSEDPSGSGYGAQAMQMASQIHMALKADGGAVSPGERLIIPVSIRINP